LVGIIADFSDRKDSNKPLFRNTIIRLIENCCRKWFAETNKRHGKDRFLIEFDGF